MAISGAAGASFDPVSQLITVLAEEQELTSIEIAETLWLAMQIEPLAPVAEPVPRGSFPVPPSPIPEMEEESESEDTPPPVQESVPRVNITAPTPQAGVLPPQVLPLWVADPTMLSDPLEIIRALKPLLQKVAAGSGKRLDESATVDNIARTRLCLPILNPDEEPWFDIILVVDRGSSMQIWQRLVKDVVRILRRYGAFRNVQVFDLAVNQGSQGAGDRVRLMSNPQHPGHRPKELIDQQGRRIAIVLSDCAGAYWWDGSLLPLFQAWGKTMPTVIWQMLPPWMWKRTALGRGTTVAIRSDLPGVANQRLKTQRQERDESNPAAQHIPVPVVTSEVRDLARWSLMVAGDRRQITPGFLLQQGGSVPRSKGIENRARDRTQQILSDGDSADSDPDTLFNAVLETIARERVDRFLELSSPHAKRLIMVLAAAPVITLPVVRLIRDAMLYEVRSPLPVAEVFLSGLLLRLPGQDDQELDRIAQEENERRQTTGAEPQEPQPQAVEELEAVQVARQDLVQYDFAPKVRNFLLKVLPAVDTIEVINSISAAVERRWNRVCDEDFQAFLMNPSIEVPDALKGLRSFASITADILEQLGGEYARLAQQLRRGIKPSPPEPEPDYDTFPTLEPFEFIDAQLEDGSDPTFPPPLQIEEFTVLTIEVQPDIESTQSDLERFEFTVARLVPQQIETQTGWVVQRQQHSAYRFVERLSNAISLEMVSIPAGTFLMGSPEDELDRRDSESPQHEVTLPSFFMGRYPVTQAQWRAVTHLPRVERELDPDPSHFKGEDRPVECVTWYEAVEFCARLSNVTGRSYRLPTEAEWEYACRAVPMFKAGVSKVGTAIGDGTPTPFHFWNMITTEVANYNGSSYGKGPSGTSRGETTSVDYFGIANAFGLSDMHGNVWEWCQDHWHSDYKGAPKDGSAWLTSKENASRILRGGSWFDIPWYCRSAFRLNNKPDNRDFNIGFRVSCSDPKTL